jgi:hypothetical protein
MRRAALAAALIVASIGNGSAREALISVCNSGQFPCTEAVLRQYTKNVSPELCGKTVPAPPPEGWTLSIEREFYDCRYVNDLTGNSPAEVPSQLKNGIYLCLVPADANMLWDDIQTAVKLGIRLGADQLADIAAKNYCPFSQSKNHRPVEALGNTMRMLGADEFDGSATKGWANTDMLVATAAPLPLVTPLEPLTTVPSPQKTLNQNDGRDL